MVTLVRASSLYGYVDLARELGLDGLSALRHVGLSPDDLRDPDDLISHEAMVTLLEYTAVVTRCADVGLRLAQRQGLGLLGPVFALIRHASTVGDALTLAARYLFVHSPALSLRLLPVVGQPLLVDLCFELDLPGQAPSPQVDELSLALLVEGLRLQSDGEVRPVLVQFPHARLSPQATYSKVFGSGCRFRAEMAAVRIRAADLQRRLPDHDPLMQALTRRYLDRHFGTEDASLGTQVRAVVRRALGAGACSRQDVAAVLQLHPRTLQRRLLAEGLVFETIVDQVRRDLFVSCLSRPDPPALSQLALMLGYGEQSALTRSCHRWFGCSPTAWRLRRHAAATPS